MTDRPESTDVYRQAMDRVSAMTAANQQRPEVRDEDELFAAHSRAAVLDGHFGHVVVD